MNFREYMLPSETNYASIDDIPEATKQILDVYDTIDGHIAEDGVLGVNELLDEFMDQRCYIVEEDDSINDALDVLAVASYRPEINDDYAWLEGLAVRRDQRGIGVGRYVIDRLVEVTRESGLSEIRLVSVPRAIPFYQRSGFTIVDGQESSKRPRMVREIA